MKRREVKGPPPSTDLLVCFPTRSHLTMMPKRICSPSKLSSSNNHRHSHHYRGKSTGGANDGGFWSKRNQMGSELSEPNSPKVTCAGQIKARPKSRSCKNWRSVMEEIERIHNNNNNKNLRKKPSWGRNAIGFKKESMQFLTGLRTFKFDLGCFGAFRNANVTSDDDEGEEEEDDEDRNNVKKLIGFEEYNIHDHENNNDNDIDEDVEGSSPRSAFSKWFRVLDENQDHASFSKQETENLKDDEAQDPCVPPSNALLLMRCRSAPTKSLSEEKEEDDDEEEGDDNDDNDDNNDDDNVDVKKRESLMELMKYEGDFYKLSCDIAKETWVVGGIKEHPISRNQSKKQCSIECLQEVKACLQ